MPRWDGKTAEERFWAKVDKSGECWLWKAGRFVGPGYGAVKRNGKQLRAHRVSWETRFGPVPAGRFVCHSCDTPSCVRPDHLFLGTAADNMADCRAKGRIASGDRNAAHAHPELMPRRERHGRAKLSAATAKAIRVAYRRGNGLVLARKYSVGSSTIYRVVKGESW